MLEVRRIGEPTEMSGLNAGQVAWLESHGVAGPLRCLAGGFRTDVLESGSGLIVRIGKSPADENTFSTEKKVMDAVRGRVDISVPQPTLVEDGLPEFPHGVMVYRRLPGISPAFPSQALASSAASVLRQLHASVPDSAVPQRAVDANGLAALVHLTERCFTEAQARTTARWQVDQSRFLAGETPRCLIHGDFWHANWLATEDGRTITGLLDFERTGIGFPQEDLAPLNYLGESFRTAALEAYCEGSARTPALLREQIRMFEVLRELRGLGWALRNPDAGELDDAIEKVASVLANYAWPGGSSRSRPAWPGGRIGVARRPLVHGPGATAGDGLSRPAPSGLHRVGQGHPLSM